MKRFLRILIFSICFLSFGTLYAQPSFEWVRSAGSFSEDIGSSMVVDASGNVYTTGHFVSTVDFDPGVGISNLTSAGNRDVFIQKVDAAGNLLWAKSFGGTSPDFVNAIALDAAGNIYTTGYFQNTADFDPGSGTYNLTAVGLTDMFVQKLDNAGNFLWARSFGGTDFDDPQSITVDALGNVYTVGAFRDTVDFDPGPGIATSVANGSYDIFVQKLDANGNYLWAKAFGGNVDDWATAVNIDGSGNVYTTGNFRSTIDFDPGAGVTLLGAQGQVHTFIQKMDSAGNFIWARSFKARSFSSTLDVAGNIYNTGYFVGLSDVDPGVGVFNLSSAGDADVYVHKIDSAGNFLWAKSFGGTSREEASAIRLDPLGNIYTAGFFEGTADFDPGASTTNLTSAGDKDVFIQKIDSAGNFLWAKSIGGTEDEEANSVAVDALGNVYTAGFFEDTTDFDPGVGMSNLGSAGDEDIFVQKMSQCPITLGVDSHVACDSFTWIDNITYTASNNTATHTLTNANAAGCDSIVSLDLIINYSSSSIDQHTACDSFTWIDNITYNTSNNTATHILTNAASCDSVVTLDLTINNVSDLTTSINGVTVTANNINATYQWLDCNNNFAVIVGQTNQSFSATANGSYAVELSENNCVDTSVCAVITSVGVNEFSNGIKVTAYPNPSEGNVRITFGQAMHYIQLKLTDIQGKVISTKTYSGLSNTDVDLPSAKGLYILYVQTEAGQRILKLLRE